MTIKDELIECAVPVLVRLVENYRRRFPDDHRPVSALMELLFSDLADWGFLDRLDGGDGYCPGAKL